jgi:CBS domain-containing protein
MNPRDPSLPLSALIDRPALVAAPDTPIRTIAQILSSHEVGIVVIEEAGEPVGVVSERDLVRGLALHDEFGVVGSYLDMTASDVMSDEPITTSGTTTVAEAMDVMRANGIRHLLVPLAAGHGVVSMRDLV